MHGKGLFLVWITEPSQWENLNVPWGTSEDVLILATSVHIRVILGCWLTIPPCWWGPQSGYFGDLSQSKKAYCFLVFSACSFISLLYWLLSFVHLALLPMDTVQVLQKLYHHTNKWFPSLHTHISKVWFKSYDTRQQMGATSRWEEQKVLASQHWWVQQAMVTPYLLFA